MSKKIFISHAKEDAVAAKRLNADIKNNSFTTWFDEDDLLPGQNWRIVIRKAIRECDFFLTLLSTRSVIKRGFVQAEQKIAHSFMEEMPESDVFIIPVRLDNCEIPYALEERHYVDMFPDYKNGLNKILRAFSALSNP